MQNDFEFGAWLLQCLVGTYKVINLYKKLHTLLGLYYLFYVKETGKVFFFQFYKNEPDKLKISKVHTITT